MSGRPAGGETSLQCIGIDGEHTGRTGRPFSRAHRAAIGLGEVVQHHRFQRDGRGGRAHEQQGSGEREEFRRKVQRGFRPAEVWITTLIDLRLMTVEANCN